MQFVVRPVNLLNIRSALQIARILTDCGIDMKEKYGLKHWHNSFFKTLLIVYYSAFKNRVYGVFDADENMNATFQAQPKGDAFHFSKLAVSPSCSGRGIGGYCLKQMELIASKNGLRKLACEVYEKSTHAFEFYRKRGFEPIGEISTRKYREIVLEKKIG